MRIVTWNCNCALRNKITQLETLQADIYVIQECEDPGQSKDLFYQQWAANSIWTGDNKHKGLGIFCNSKIVLNNNKWDDGANKYFISAQIDKQFNVVAVWNHEAKSVGFKYIGQFWKYLQINKGLMRNSIILGDFNSNKIWDKTHKGSSHSDVVRELKEIGIESLYHDLFEQMQGEEKDHTFFLYRNSDKGYHLDYAFADKSYFTTIKTFSIGPAAEWLKFSDHLPLIIDL